MTYEELLIEADGRGYIVKEKPLRMNNGRIKGDRIAIRRDIPTERQKAEILLEELEHGYSTCGNILDQSIPLNRIQEFRARRRAYCRQVTFDGLISAYEAGCRSLYEVSEELNISEEFLVEALKRYADKYGMRPVRHENHLIYFFPTLHIVKILETPDEASKQATEYVAVRRWSDEDIQRIIEKHRKERLAIEKQLKKLEKKCQERDNFLVNIGIDPYQYSYALAERSILDPDYRK